MFGLEAPILLGGMDAAVVRQMAGIGVFIRQFADDGSEIEPEAAEHLDLLRKKFGRDERRFCTSGGLGAAKDTDPLAGGVDEDGRDEDEEDAAENGVQLVIEDDRGIRRGFGGGEEADAGGGGEYFFDRGGEGDGDEPRHGEERDPHPAGSVHFYEDRGADAERDDG